MPNTTEEQDRSPFDRDVLMAKELPKAQPLPEGKYNIPGMALATWVNWCREKFFAHRND